MAQIISLIMYVFFTVGLFMLLEYYLTANRAQVIRLQLQNLGLEVKSMFPHVDEAVGVSKCLHTWGDHAFDNIMSSCLLGRFTLKRMKKLEQQELHEEAERIFHEGEKK